MSITCSRIRILSESGQAECPEKRDKERKDGTTASKSGIKIQFALLKWNLSITETWLKSKNYNLPKIKNIVQLYLLMQTPVWNGFFPVTCFVFLTGFTVLNEPNNLLQKNLWKGISGTMTFFYFWNRIPLWTGPFSHS